MFSPKSEDYDGESSDPDSFSESDDIDEESKLMASMGLPVEFVTSSAKKRSVGFREFFFFFKYHPFSEYD